MQRLFFILALFILPSVALPQYYTLTGDFQDPDKPFTIPAVFSGNTPFLRYEQFERNEPWSFENTTNGGPWTMYFRYSYGQYDTNGMVTLDGTISSNVVTFGGTNVLFQTYDYYFSILGINLLGQQKTFARGIMHEKYDPASGTNITAMVGQMNLSWWSNNIGAQIVALQTGKLDRTEFSSALGTNEPLWVAASTSVLQRIASNEEAVISQVASNAWLSTNINSKLDSNTWATAQAAEIATNNQLAAWALANSNAIAAETTARIGADTALSNQLVNTSNSLAAAISALPGATATDTNSLIAGIAANSNAVVAEAAARVAADTNKVAKTGDTISGNLTNKADFVFTGAGDDWHMGAVADQLWWGDDTWADAMVKMVFDKTNGNLQITGDYIGSAAKLTDFPATLATATQLSAETNARIAADDTKLNMSGGAMTGVLTVSTNDTPLIFPARIGSSTLDSGKIRFTTRYHGNPFTHELYADYNSNLVFNSARVFLGYNALLLTNLPMTGVSGLWTALSNVPIDNVSGLSTALASKVSSVAMLPTLTVGDLSSVGTNLCTGFTTQTGTLGGVKITNIYANLTSGKTYAWGLGLESTYLGTSRLTCASFTLTNRTPGSRASNYFSLATSTDRVVLTISSVAGMAQIVTNVYVCEITNGSGYIAGDLYVAGAIYGASTSYVQKSGDSVYGDLDGQSFTANINTGTSKTYGIKANYYGSLTAHAEPFYGNYGVLTLDQLLVDENGTNTFTISARDPGHLTICGPVVFSNSVAVSGSVSAVSFSGSGAGLTGIATGTPLYAYTETDPAWLSSSGSVWSAINGKQAAGSYAVVTNDYPAGTLGVLATTDGGTTAYYKADAADGGAEADPIWAAASNGYATLTQAGLEPTGALALAQAIIASNLAAAVQANFNGASNAWIKGATISGGSADSVTTNSGILTITWNTNLAHDGTSAGGSTRTNTWDAVGAIQQDAGATCWVVRGLPVQLVVASNSPTTIATSITATNIDTTTWLQIRAGTNIIAWGSGIQPTGIGAHTTYVGRADTSVILIKPAYTNLSQMYQLR